MKMHIIESGNTAAALGVKLCRAQVIAAYPITPQFVLDGEVFQLDYKNSANQATLFALRGTTRDQLMALVRAQRAWDARQAEGDAEHVRAELAARGEDLLAGALDAPGLDLALAHDGAASCETAGDQQGQQEEEGLLHRLTRAAWAWAGVAFGAGPIPTLRQPFRSVSKRSGRLGCVHPPGSFHVTSPSSRIDPTTASGVPRGHRACCHRSPGRWGESCTARLCSFSRSRFLRFCCSLRIWALLARAPCPDARDVSNS